MRDDPKGAVSQAEEPCPVVPCIIVWLNELLTVKYSRATAVAVKSVQLHRADPAVLWNSNDTDLRVPSADWRGSPMALIMTITASCSKTRTSPREDFQLRCLIDTGARIPLIFATGLFDKHRLTPAKFPVHFVTANGDHMTGGD